MGGNIVFAHMTDPASTGKEFLLVFLVVVRENESAKNIGASDGNDGYLPEEDVLWSRIFWSNDAVFLQNIGSDKIKSRRKLQEGDSIRIVMKASGSATDHRFASYHSYFLGS